MARWADEEVEASGSQVPEKTTAKSAGGSGLPVNNHLIPFRGYSAFPKLEPNMETKTTAVLTVGGDGEPCQLRIERADEFQSPDWG